MVRTPWAVAQDKAAAEAYQLKYYAKGVGIIKVGRSGADKSKETLELARIETLSPKAMDAMREKALKLEKRAYDSKNVYAHTPPAERLQ